MKRFFVVIIPIIAIILISCGNSNTQGTSASEEKEINYEYMSVIESCGFKIDNTKAKLLVAKEGKNYFQAVDNVDSFNYRIDMRHIDYEEGEKDVSDVINSIYDSNAKDDSDASNITKIEICGHECYTFHHHNEENGTYNQFYVLENKDNLLLLITLQSIEEDNSVLTTMIESMEEVSEEESTSNENDKSQNDTATDNTDKKTGSSNIIKRELDDMDEDEVFMVMALAEKEIKNNLKYDANKAKFSHIPDNWYMSEQDGFYTVTTTFEAPNEYGTMQKAGAVVSFTVTSKNSDGWNYKDEDVYIEWKN